MSDADSDAELMAAFRENDSQEAFSELVSRYVNLVFSVSSRQVRSPQVSEEVTQSVFADLVRAIRSEEMPSNLPAWLHVVARRRAIDAARQDVSRRARELAAGALNEANAADVLWHDIEPVLDDAIAALPHLDRAIVVMRFFQQKSIREIGDAFGMSENAAQKRLSRAIESLRALFAKNGITTSAAALTACIAPHAVLAAPPTLGATISSTTWAAPIALAKSGVLATTIMTTSQKLILATTALALIGFGSYEYLAHKRADALARQLSSDLAAAQRREASQRKQLLELQSSPRTPTLVERPLSEAQTSEPTVKPLPTLAAVEAVKAAGATVAVRVLNSDWTATPDIINFLHLTPPEQAAFEAAMATSQDQVLRSFASRAVLTSADDFEVRVTVPPLVDVSGPYETLTTELVNVLGKERVDQLLAVGMRDLNTKMHFFGKAETTFIVNRMAGGTPTGGQNLFSLTIANASHPGPRPGSIAGDPLSVNQFTTFDDPKIGKYKWLTAYDQPVSQLKVRER